MALAGTAATMAAQTLGDPAHQPVKGEAVDKDCPAEEPRVGVFLCRGGLKAMGADPDTVINAIGSVKDVVFVSEDAMLCTPDRIAAIKQQIHKNAINRVVVAPCILKTNNLVFQEALQVAGINRMLVETAAVPQHKRGNMAAASAPAAELVAKAIANVKTYEPLHWHAEPVVPQAMVIGGGISGIAAALAVADRGFQTTIVEQDAELGGFLREHAAGLEGPELPQVFSEMVSRVKKHKKVEILTNSRVTKFKGRQGHFVATIESGAGSGKTMRQIDPGIAILAVGTVEHNPAEYFYGSDPRIITGTEARGLIQQGVLPDKKGSTYAFIQCVGSRNADRRYCSRTCCLEAVDNALAIKISDPWAQVYLFYRDLRTPGFSEKRFLEARKAGVVFVQYDETEPPVLVKGSGDRLILSASDPASSKHISIYPDRVILAVPQLARPEAREVAKLFRIQVNSDGFLMEMHSNLGSIAFPNGGIFIAGSAHGPQSVAECLSQARGVAARAARVLSQRFLRMGGTIAKVDIDKCAACLTCVRVCPFSVPSINRESKAMGSASIVSAECRGCGMCAAECPNKAIELCHYEVDKLRDRVDIALAEVSCGEV
jgi:heterodisulfide reductase subunit A